MRAESRAASAEADARRCAGLDADLKVTLPALPRVASCRNVQPCTCNMPIPELLMSPQETRRRVDICLELIGERNERIEELEDNIAEMKAIFRSQLSLAADQLAAAVRKQQSSG